MSGIGISTEGFVGGGGGGGSDITPPVLTVVSPTPNTVPGSVGAFAADYATASVTPIVLTATDPDGLVNILFLQVIARFLDGTTEAVYGADGFASGYTAGSSTSFPTNGIGLSIRRDRGWPAAPTTGALAVTFVIDVIDFGGNLTSLTAKWQLPVATAFVPALSIGSTTDPNSNIVKLLTAVCSAGFQPLEDTMQQVFLQRTIDNSVGTQLDAIGKLVGQPRNGLADDDYRRYCRAGISANRSKGTVEDLLKVIDLVIFDDSATYVVTPSSPATVTIAITELGITDDLANVAFIFMRRSAATGVRVILEYGNVTPLFTFDLGPGLDTGHLAGVIDH